MKRELSLKWLLLGAFLINFGNSFVWPLTTVYVHDQLGQSLTVAGLVLMFFSGANVLGSVLAGSLFDRANPQYLMGAGLVGAIATMIALHSFNAWPAYPILLTVVGFFNGWLMTLLNSYGTRLRGHDGRFIFNMIYFFNNLGMVFGTTVAGPIYEVTHNQVGPLFLITAALYLILLGVVACFFVLPKMAVTQHHHEVEKVAMPRANRQIIWTLCGALMLTWFIYSQWSSNLSVYITDQGISMSLYSLLWTLNGLMVITFQLMLNWVTQWVKNDYLYIYFGLLTMTLSFGLLLVAHSYGWFVVGMVILTLGETTAFPMIPALVNQLTPMEEKGRYQGIVNALMAVGKALGPLGGGIMIESLGYVPLFLICMAIGAVICLVVMAVTLRLKQAVSEF